MTKPLRSDAEAEDELHAAAIWYEQQRRGLGRSFLAAVNQSIREIEDTPDRWPFASGIPESIGVRRHHVR